MPTDSADERSEDGFGLPENAEKYVDIEVFEQILEMDDDDVSREFSRQLVFGFFDQAATTFEEMDEAIKKKDLAALSALGHFLKGSSATLGLFKVRDSCEKIQHYGEMKDAEGTEKVDDEEKCLESIKTIMPDMKKDYEEVEVWLKGFYGPEPED